MRVRGAFGFFPEIIVIRYTLRADFSFETLGSSFERDFYSLLNCILYVTLVIELTSPKVIRHDIVMEGSSSQITFISYKSNSRSCPVR